MGYLLKMVIFNSYVKLPEGMIFYGFIPIKIPIKSQKHLWKKKHVSDMWHPVLPMVIGSSDCEDEGV